MMCGYREKQKKPLLLHWVETPRYAGGQCMSNGSQSVAFDDNGAEYTPESTSVNRCYEVFL